MPTSEVCCDVIAEHEECVITTGGRKVYRSCYGTAFHMVVVMQCHLEKQDVAAQFSHRS